MTASLPVSSPAKANAFTTLRAADVARTRDRSSVDTGGASWLFDALAIPGADFARWRSSTPDQREMRFYSPELARLGDNILRDTINGERLLVTGDPAQPQAPAPTDPRVTPWYDNPMVIMRTIAAMPGITEWMWGGTGNLEKAYFMTRSLDRANELRSVINDHIGKTEIIIFPREKPPAK